MWESVLAFIILGKCQAVSGYGCKRIQQSTGKTLDRIWDCFNLVRNPSFMRTKFGRNCYYNIRDCFRNHCHYCNLCNGY